MDFHDFGKRYVVVNHLKPARQYEETFQFELAKRLFESKVKVLEELGGTSDRLPAFRTYFEKQDELYLVREFVAGDTLVIELAAGKLSEAQTIKILQGILTALAVVHSKNKIHRDLKPDSIIRRAKDGKLVLIGFGCVMEVRQTAGLWSTDVSGTPVYAKGTGARLASTGQ